MLLALETSCDDTCAAVVDGGADPLQRRLLAGRLPRALRRRRPGGRLAPPPRAGQRGGRRRRSTRPATGLAEVDAVAVTQGPGLIGALLVGLSTAKALAAAHRKPLIPVDHLHGHVAANFLEPDPLEPPFLCLIASGGHTLLAGVREHSSLRDPRRRPWTTPPGEAFDKGARLLGLGYPGGPAIQRAAEGGDPGAFEFPLR